VRAERQSKRGGGTEKNLQKANSAKVNSLATKTNEAMRKSIAKIRQARNYTYKVKMQKNSQSSTQTIVHNTYQKWMQNAEMKQEKKCNTHFAITHPKKTVTTPGKSPTLKVNACSKNR